MLYGEQQVAEKWYYLRPLNGARVENEAVYIAGESPSGGSSKVVYYDADGSMAYGERNVGGSWYYMQPGTGARTENSFVELDGSYLANGPKTVYYNGLGQMVYGRYQTTSGWKYFDPRSGAMQTGNESIIGSIIDTMRSQMGSTRGWYYENAALAAGGDLCWGGRGNWCATFTWWAFNNAGYGNLFCGGRTILDPQLILEWFCTDGRATLADGRRGQTLHGMERGDIVFFGYDSVPGVTSYATHVGYVTSVNNDGFWTIEGNAGGEVASVYHEINGRINRAFARPAYNS